MSISGRLFAALRANMGHAVRRLKGSDPLLPPPTAGRGSPPPHSSPSPDPHPSPSSRHQESFERDYRALELAYGGSPQQIKRAHRGLLRRYHPDHFSNDPSRLADATRLSQELTAARDRLLEAHEQGLLP